MSSQHIQAYSRVKMERPKSSLLSWIFGDSTDSKNNIQVETDEKPDEKKERNSIYLKEPFLPNRPPTVPVHALEPKTSTHKTDNNLPSEIKIPARHQSRLYTPFHDESLSADIERRNQQEYKRRSCYSARLSIDTNLQGSSLTRSASWQPSSSTNNIDQRNNVMQCIPDRRTSRNYAQDPDIQARLNEMIQSKRTLKVTQMITQHQQLQ